MSSPSNINNNNKQLPATSNQAEMINMPAASATGAKNTVTSAVSASGAPSSAATSAAPSAAVSATAVIKKDKQKDARETADVIMASYHGVEDIVTVAEGKELVYISNVASHGKSPLVSIAGTKIQIISKHSLEILCGRLEIIGIRTANKAKLCDLICAYKINKPMID